ncbi:MAG: DUF1294 domain-containing protein [Desulfobulbaceae bacterium]|nr:DUF1294 domain-containing protein [Desulfobulbaceae bacterium]
MRYQGKITTWKDEQGFGFIIPNSGGEQVFFHIKSFSNRQRRPRENEIVTYELKMDDKGRPQAKCVALVGECVPSSTSAGPGNITLLFAVSFLLLVAYAAFNGQLPLEVFCLYLFASFVSFVVYAHDKSAAINDQWRTKESTLHLFALVGGWPGALAAQRMLRHKSKKLDFQIVFWATVILNCGVLGWLWLLSSGVETLLLHFGAT